MMIDNKYILFAFLCEFVMYFIGYQKAKRKYKRVIADLKEQLENAKG